MQRAKNLETVERERERESYLLDKIAYISVVILNLFLKNKDPCYGLRLLYLRI